MMRRTVSAILALLLIFGLSACNTSPGGGRQNGEVIQQEQRQNISAKLKEYFEGQITEKECRDSVLRALNDVSDTNQRELALDALEIIKAKKTVFEDIKRKMNYADRLKSVSLAQLNDLFDVPDEGMFGLKDVILPYIQLTITEQDVVDYSRMLVDKYMERYSKDDASDEYNDFITFAKAIAYDKKKSVSEEIKRAKTKISQISESKETKETPKPNTENLQNIKVTPTPKPVNTPKVVSSNGDMHVWKVYAKKAKIKINLKYNGTGMVVINLKKMDGTTVKNIYNNVGKTKLKRTFATPKEGWYLVEIYSSYVSAKVTFDF